MEKCGCVNANTFLRTSSFIVMGWRAHRFIARTNREVRSLGIGDGLMTSLNRRLTAVLLATRDYYAIPMEFTKFSKD